MASSLPNRELAPLLRRIERPGSRWDEERLLRGLLAAKEAYGTELHWTGETVLEHTIGVLEILSPFEPDEDAVIACLLHHVLERKTMTLQDLEEQFGPKVRNLVAGVHLLAHVTLEGKRHSTGDLRLMLLSVSDDIRVLLITLCDRARNLAFVDTMAKERARRLSKDVLQLFAPVAARLGIYSLKHMLESEAFPVIYPSDAERINDQLQKIHTEFPGFLEKAQSELEAFLAEQGIAAVVSGREKIPYSIFLKAKRKSLSDVQTVHDLFALRVIVSTEEDCYRVLGLLHRMGRPVPNRFKDYIAFPKPNGYQSLHTTLAGFSGMPEGVLLEVQIRTKSMDREAQYGIAAHWSYKEYGATEKAMEKVELHSVLFGQQMLEDDEEGEGGETLVDHIFVLTPKGDIVELPEGATPLDFAFQVHTDLGLAFRSARVNGSIVSLDYHLENGDVVEIQKYGTPQPSPQWLQLLRMGSSRGKLRRYLYAQERPQYVARGRDLLNAELKKRGLPLLTTDLSVLRIFEGQPIPLAEREDILMKIGQASERASSILPHFDLLKAVVGDGRVRKKTSAPSRAGRGNDLVGVEGGVPMPVRFAKCCNANEEDRERIVGNVNREGEVMIHRASCSMGKNVNPGRRIDVWWI